jgi:hypothetical protein
MKSVFLVTNKLALYRDEGRFHSAVRVTSDITPQNLASVIPPKTEQTVYFTRESAEAVLQKKRGTDLAVRSATGSPYLSKCTSVILEIQLKNNDLQIQENEVKRTINRNLFDLSQPINVINLEKDYKGNMPTVINIKEADLPTPSSCCTLS